MQLNKATDYALQILILLAENEKHNIHIVPAARLAKNIGVTPRYLMKVACVLREDGCIGVKSGSGGGYYLNIEPEEIDLYHIINLMEGTPLAAIRDYATENSPLYSIYTELQEIITEYFKVINIADLVERGLS